MGSEFIKTLTDILKVNATLKYFGIFHSSKFHIVFELDLFSVIKYHNPIIFFKCASGFFSSWAVWHFGI